MRYSPEAAKAAGVQPSGELVRHFPDKARAAGIQGSAELSCGQTVHLGLRDCVLLSESPEGYDFGGAALSLAEASPENPHVSAKALKAGLRMTFYFCLNPANIFPDVLSMPHLILNPDVKN